MHKFNKLILLILTFAMVFSLMTVGASAVSASPRLTEGWYNMYLYLGAYGATDITNDREKLYPNNSVDVEELLITTDYSGGVWLRVRDSSSRAAATSARQLYYHDSWWRPSYNSGYGIVGNKYYIKGQTASASAYDASVTGIWRP